MEQETARFADLVAASGRVQATRARTEKVRALAEVLRAVPRGDVEAAVAFLSGRTRQGRIGVGWATVGAVTDATPAGQPTLSIGDVDRAVGELQAIAGTGSAQARRELLGRLLSRATPPEADFLRRLLLGEVRQGALEGIMADAVAAAAGVPARTVRRAAMFAGDLAQVAVVAMEAGERGLEAIGLEPLRPVQPMLAATAADVAEAIGDGGVSSVEWKLDGARIQAHRSGRDVRLFTRNLNDVTERLPDVVEVVRSLPADRLVLDGEVLGVGDEDRPDLFQDTMSRFGRRLQPAPGLGVWFFDLLHADGTDLVDRPLVERLERLGLVAGRWRVPGILTEDVGEAARFLDAALDAGHEGVMVKAAASPYEAGRRGKAWRKVKPVRTLDLVVLAAEWGYGRRQGWLSNIHLGARDADHPDRFVMVGKTFKGMTDEMLRWQTERFLTLEQGRYRNVVELVPALVVEVALDGVQVSSRYPGGVALRFARVRRYRPDRSPADADTIDAVRALLPAQ